MKRLISIIIALCLLVSAMPILAREVAADNILYYDNFLIEKNGDFYVMVGILDPIDTDKIIVPQEIHGWVYDKNNKKEYLSHECYTIAAEAFKNCTSIRKIEFEKGVELIPYGLCSGMIYLEEVILPESVKTIENEAFRGCESLKTIDLSKIENLGRSAFEGCISLESVTLSENIEAIDAYTFYGCERLEKVIGLHEGITIGQDAFRGTKVAPYNEVEKEQIKAFSDVHHESEYYEAIKALDSLGIMSGYADGTFGLEGALTRAEAAAILVRLLKLDDEVKLGETTFADVDKSHWASGYINIAVAEGIINGQGDGTFAPDELVTCNQIVKMLVCALGYEPTAFANGGWQHGGYGYTAEKIGLIESESESNDHPVTRGKAALLCYKALDIDIMRKSTQGMYSVSEGDTILTQYWGGEHEFVEKFYFAKVFGFKLPESSVCFESNYHYDDGVCYIGKIKFYKKDLEYIKENLAMQDFAEGVNVEKSDILFDGRHKRDAHCPWWDVKEYGVQKIQYYWIKEEKTARYTHAIEFEADIVTDKNGIYWLYVYKNDKQIANR